MTMVKDGKWTGYEEEQGSYPRDYFYDFLKVLQVCRGSTRTAANPIDERRTQPRNVFARFTSRRVQIVALLLQLRLPPRRNIRNDSPTVFVRQ